MWGGGIPRPGTHDDRATVPRSLARAGSSARSPASRHPSPIPTRGRAARREPSRRGGHASRDELRADRFRTTEMARDPCPTWILRHGGSLGSSRTSLAGSPVSHLARGPRGALASWRHTRSPAGGCPRLRRHVTRRVRARCVRTERRHAPGNGLRPTPNGPPSTGSGALLWGDRHGSGTLWSFPNRGPCCRYRTGPRVPRSAHTASISLAPGRPGTVRGQLPGYPSHVAHRPAARPKLLKRTSRPDQDRR
jgi:hypothetical protein